MEQGVSGIEQIVSFPGIGILDLVLSRVAFTLFGKPIYWYGVLIAAAFLAGIGYVLLRSRHFGLDSDQALDVLLGAVIGAIVGARLYYVIFAWDMYRGRFWDIFKIWEGGLAVYGGILGGFLVGGILCRRKKIRFLPMADITVCGLLIGQGIGRWGNFFNVEAFGGVTDGVLRMSSPSVASFLLSTGQIGADTAAAITEGTLGVHPTFLYESTWCLLGFILLVLYTNHRRFDGELLLLYMLWYGVERSFVEGLRTDSLMVGDYRVSQLLSLVIVLVAIVLLIKNYRRVKHSRDPEECMLYVHTGEAREALALARQKRDEKKNKILAPAQTEESEQSDQAPEKAGRADLQPKTSGQEEQEDESKAD